MRLPVFLLAVLAVLGGFSIELPALPAFDLKTLAGPEKMPAITAESLPTPLPASTEVFGQPSVGTASDNLPLAGVVNAQALNVRQCASKSCRAIAWIFEGDEVQIFAGKNGWMRISAQGGLQGEGQWVYGNYVDIKEAPHFDRRH